MKKWMLIAAVLGMSALVGCSRTTLETGYRVKALDSNQYARESYYADPFDPETRDAAQAREDFRALRTGR